MGPACCWDKGIRNGYRMLVMKPIGESPFGRPRRRWEDVITMDLWKMNCEDGR
jgi:hypothetical protein